MGGPLLYDKKRMRRQAQERRMRARDESKKAPRTIREIKPRVCGRIPERILRTAYLDEGKSMREIAERCSCSVHKVAYWITAYSIPIRNQKEAAYRAHHRGGNPFSLDDRGIHATDSAFVSGLGFGLCWNSVVNSGNVLQVVSVDPRLVRAFMHFLHSVCGVQKTALRFRLYIANEAYTHAACTFWADALSVKKEQFLTPLLVPSRKEAKRGRKRDDHGSIAVIYRNTKLARLMKQHIATLAFGE